MQHEFPDYYRQFECIGPACKDSCCIGWELDIDEETYEYYRQVEGEFGERLRSSMSDEENTFILGEGDRCPFLNQKNLCDIYIKLGEQSLCNICTEYPRAYESVEQYMQSDLSLSCMEVGRIFFSSNEYIHYETRGDGKRTQKIKDKKLRKILEIRQLFLNILQSNDLDRQGYTWRKKALLLLQVSEEIQKQWNESRDVSIKSISLELNEYNNTQDTDPKELLSILDGLEVIDSTWTNTLHQVKKRMIKEFSSSCSDKMNVWYINIITYFIFRYLLRTYYDNNIKSKVIFSIYSTYVIYCMDYNRWVINERKFSVEDRIDIAHQYSKEVEHSQENIDYLEEEFVFDEKNIQKMLSGFLNT